MKIHLHRNVQFNLVLNIISGCVAATLNDFCSSAFPPVLQPYSHLWHSPNVAMVIPLFLASLTIINGFHPPTVFWLNIQSAKKKKKKKLETLSCPGPQVLSLQQGNRNGHECWVMGCIISNVLLFIVLWINKNCVKVNSSNMKMHGSVSTLTSDRTSQTVNKPFNSIFIG